MPAKKTLKLSQEDFLKAWAKNRKAKTWAEFSDAMIKAHSSVYARERPNEYGIFRRCASIKNALKKQGFDWDHPERPKKPTQNLSTIWAKLQAENKAK